VRYEHRLFNPKLLRDRIFEVELGEVLFRLAAYSILIRVAATCMPADSHLGEET